MNNIYYETVTTREKSDTEWVEYAGYDKEKALERCEDENEHHAKATFSGVKNDYHTEVRAYKLPDERKFEELSDDEQCEVLSCYDTIE